MNVSNYERLIIIASLSVMVFFVYDIVVDFHEYSANGWYFYTEVIITVMMFALIVFQFKKMLDATKAFKVVNSKLLAIQGELANIIEKQFDVWRLTPAEKAITWLMIKGP